MERKRDYYEVLGVSRDADKKAIERAFHALAMRYHPDHSTEPDATECFKEIAEAYAVLSDAAKRRRYDASGFAGIEGYSNEDLFGSLDLGSLFGHQDSMFGDSIFDRFFGDRPTAPRKGANIRTSIVVTLETLATGGEETINIERPEACQSCDGSGAEPGTQPKPCDACDGSGQIARRHQEGNTLYQQFTTCSNCHGRGETIESPCESCKGTGWVSRIETLTVKVPPGLDEGRALRVPGRGHPSADPEGPPGDLLVLVETERDDRFERRGPHLWRIEEIEIADAVLGTTLCVPTLDGSTEVEIPPGTQPDATLRIVGEGLPYPSSDARGHLYVIVRVRIPTSLTDEERELFEELRSQRKRAPAE